MGRKHKDITGQRFGRLTAIEYAGRAINGKTLWLCKCDCGKEIITQYGNLQSGLTRSCGCLRKEKSAIRGKNHARNNVGEFGTRLYQRWNNLKGICNNPKNYHYRYYGGKGITVSPEWADDFQVFKAWALSHGFKDGDSIIRKDKKGPYSPDNCIIVSQSEVKPHGKETAAAT